MNRKNLNIVPFFLVLIPLFLVLNGMNQFHGLVSGKSALSLLAVLVAAVLIVYFFISKMIGNQAKAALMTAWLAVLYLFFGTIHDEMKEILPSGILSYRYFLPLWILFVIAGILLIRRSPAGKNGFNRYLNILFFVLCLYEGSRMLLRREQKADFFLPTTGEDNFIHAATKTARPNIYLLVFDSYLRPDTFRDKFHADQENIDSFLHGKGFYVFSKSRSHYNNTTESLCSVLNMRLLNKEGYFNKISPDQSYPTHLRLIESNRSCELLDSLGYTVKNGSLFNLKNQPSPFRQPYLPNNKALLLEKTLPNKLVQDVFPLEWIVKFKLSLLYEPYVFGVRNYNQSAGAFLEKVLSARATGPEFVYSHLLLPHAPYYYDGNEKETAPSQLMNPEKYPGYYKYAGDQIRKYVDMILERNGGNSIIVVMSDHGIKDPEEKDREIEYKNLFSIYYPDKDYSSLNDSIQISNTFRLIFNKYFGQQYALIRGY